MRQLTKLFKGECINLDAASFVYSAPPVPETEKEKESIPIPVQEEEGMDLQSAARVQARAIVDSANRYSSQMSAFSRKQAQEAYEKAKEDGYRRGYEEGRSHAMADNEEALEQIVKLVKDLDQGREVLWKQLEHEAVNLALAISRKVVNAQLSKDDQAFISIFRKAVEGLNGQKCVRLSVSQQEVTFVTANSDYLKSLIRDAQRLEVQVLAEAPPGTCIVETDDVYVDASAQKQLDTIEQAVQSVR